MTGRNGAPSAALTITLRSDGTVNVTGPITNRLLCYGLLELARDAIRDYQPPVAPRVILASPGPIRPVA